MEQIKKELKKIKLSSINSIILQYLKHNPCDMKLTSPIKQKLQFEFWDPDDPDTETIFNYTFKDEGNIYPILYIEYQKYDHHNEPRILATLQNIEEEWIITNKLYYEASKYNQDEEEKEEYIKMKKLIFSTL